jgi:hypothetical protein
MDIGELERAWHDLDGRLAGLERQARREREHRAFASVRARLRPLALGQLVQLAIAVAIVVVAGPYWVGHWGTPHLVVYGVAIHAYGIALLIVALTQLMAVWRVDYRQPVLVVQRRLLQLAWLRVRSERWLLMAGFVVWVPFVFAVAAAAGLDVWRTSPLTVWLNLAVGIAMAAGVGWLTFRFGDRFACDASGRSLVAAQRDISELAGEGPAENQG